MNVFENGNKIRITLENVDTIVTRFQEYLNRDEEIEEEEKEEEIMDQSNTLGNTLRLKPPTESASASLTGRQYKSQYQERKGIVKGRATAAISEEQKKIQE